jgi:hypothetical protein
MNKILLSIVFVTVLITGCKKNESRPNYYSEQSFGEDFLQKSDLTATNITRVNFASTYELGLDFKVNVKGNITKLFIRIPDINPALRVTIWDKERAKPIRTEIVNINKAGEFVEIDIQDLLIEREKEYSISMNTNDFYERYTSSVSRSAFPTTVNNVTLTAYRWQVNVTEQIFPVIITPYAYAGDCFFKFQQVDEF